MREDSRVILDEILDTDRLQTQLIIFAEEKNNSQMHSLSVITNWISGTLKRGDETLGTTLKAKIAC